MDADQALLFKDLGATAEETRAGSRSRGELFQSASPSGTICSFRIIACSMKGASSRCFRLARASSRSSNSGSTSRANNSSD